METFGCACRFTGAENAPAAQVDWCEHHAWQRDAMASVFALLNDDVLRSWCDRNGWDFDATKAAGHPALKGTESAALLLVLRRMMEELRRFGGESDLARAVANACANDIALHCEDLSLYSDALDAAHPPQRAEGGQSGSTVVALVS
jgi:hypothetical protein